MKNQRLRAWYGLKSNRCRPISPEDFAYGLANHKTELKVNKSVSHYAARIQMMSHHMNILSETLPCPSDFHDTPSPSLLFFSIALSRQLKIAESQK